MEAVNRVVQTGLAGAAKKVAVLDIAGQAILSATNDIYTGQPALAFLSGEIDFQDTAAHPARLARLLCGALSVAQ